MLQDKYLPTFHFSSRHSIVIEAKPAQVFPLIINLDFARSTIIRILFFLRGIPSSMLTLDGLAKHHFLRLETVPDEEIIIGLVGRFWVITGDLRNFHPTEFATLHLPGYAKATWSFRLVPDGTHTLLETETRIWCPDETSRKKFSTYWFVIKPFSGIVRKAILKSIKQRAESRI